MIKRKKIAKKSEIPEGKLKVYNIDGESIAICNLGGEFYAFKNECPHMDFPLTRGIIIGETVTCPAHGSKFNIKTGEVLSMPAAYPLKTYRIDVEGNDIIIEMD